MEKGEEWGEEDGGSKKQIAENRHRGSGVQQEYTSLKGCRVGKGGLVGKTQSGFRQVQGSWGPRAVTGPAGESCSPRPGVSSLRSAAPQHGVPQSVGRCPPPTSPAPPSVLPGVQSWETSRANCP